MKLNFKSFGEGEPIIILHGLFGTLDNWQSFAKKLADQYMVFIVDQRDHGKSPHSDQFDYEILAEDLYEFMEDHGIRSTHLMGHSMGGKTALQFANQYDYLLDKLIIVDIAPKLYEGNHESIFNAMMNVPLSEDLERSEIEKFLSKDIKELSTRQFLMKNLKRRKEGGFQWKMNLDLLYNNYENILAAIDFDHEVDVETLFVRGSNSNYISDKDWEMTKEDFTHARLETVVDSGHWIHAEKPQELLDLVKQFLD